MKTSPLFGLILSCFSVLPTQGQEWVNVGNGLGGNVYDLISFDQNLFAAGRLDEGLRAVYYWDGEKWYDTANFWEIAYPLTMEIFQDELYTSGDFPYQSGAPTVVYKWQNGEWSQQGEDFKNGAWNSVKKLKPLATTFMQEVNLNPLVEFRPEILPGGMDRIGVPSETGRPPWYLKWMFFRGNWSYAIKSLTLSNWTTQPLFTHTGESCKPGTTRTGRTSIAFLNSATCIYWASSTTCYTFLPPTPLMAFQ